MMKTKHGKETRGTFCNASASVVSRSFLGQRKRNSQNRQVISITKVYQTLLPAHYGLPSANSKQRTANGEQTINRQRLIGSPKSGRLSHSNGQRPLATLRFRFVNETGKPPPSSTRPLLTLNPRDSRTFLRLAHPVARAVVGRSSCCQNVGCH